MMKISTAFTTFACTLALALVTSAPANAQIVVDEGLANQFPIPGSIYQGTSSSTRAVETEILSMQLSGSPGGSSVPLPIAGQTFNVDSFFDIFIDMRVQGSDFQVDSFFDIDYRIEFSSSDGDRGSWQTEMVSMSLSGSLPDGRVIEIRESPSLPSLGQHTLTTLPESNFQVDSFFDIWPEISIDNGPFVPAEAPIRVNLTGVPEPTSSGLMLIGTTLIAGLRRRR